MSHITLKQPDGSWCVFSTVVDSFLLENASRKEVREFLLDRERDRIDDLLDGVESGERPSRWTYEKAVERAESE